MRRAELHIQYMGSLFQNQLIFKNFYVKLEVDLRTNGLPRLCNND